MNPPGKTLALWGTALQVGSLLSLAATITAMLRVYDRVSAASGGVDVRSLVDELRTVIVPILLGQALALVGAALLLHALFHARYRAPWFHATMWVLAILWLLSPPIGTILGLIVVVYLVRHEKEFAAR